MRGMLEAPPSPPKNPPTPSVCAGTVKLRTLYLQMVYVQYGP